VGSSGQECFCSRRSRRGLVTGRGPPSQDTNSQESWEREAREGSIIKNIYYNGSLYVSYIMK
jgi:hypothetical protein